MSQHLSRLMFEGPERELMLTENAQPALLAVSLAVMRVLENDAGFSMAQQAAYVAGHSLGEYSALAAAGALSPTEAARLVKRRGQAMQKAVPVGEGAMAALLGLDIDAAREVAEAATGGGLVCAVANDNSPGQIVVSGHRDAVERAVALAAERGARRSIMLPVSAPFHCPLMRPVADIMAEALADGDVARAAGAARRQRHRRRDQRPRRNQGIAGRAGYPDGALARNACCCSPPRRSRRSSRSAPAACWPASIKRIDRKLGAVSVGAPAEVEALHEDGCRQCSISPARPRW